MNILGVGPAELVIVLVLLLVVAGPKRMVQWAYIAGRYMAQLRAMWQETAQMLQQELEQAGIEPETVDAVRDLTRGRSRRVPNPLDGVVDKMKKPLEQDVLRPVEDVMQQVGDTPLAPKPQQQHASGNTSAQAESEAPAEDSVDSEQDTSTSGRYDAWTPN